MRLTKTSRAAFVAAVMADTPDKVAELVEEIRKKTLAYAIKTLPKEVREAYKLDPSWIGECYVGSYRPINVSIYFPSKNQHPNDHKDKVSTFFKKELNKVEGIAKEREELKSKLEAIVAGCNTRKQLIEALPELEKYAPKEPTVTKNLPAIRNVVEDLKKAGFPSKKK